MSTPTCSTHETHQHGDSIVQKMWSRLHQRLQHTPETSRQRFQEMLLKEQREKELLHLSRRNADIHRMILRQIL